MPKFERQPIDNVVDTLIENGTLPGAVVGVAIGGDIVYLEARGVMDEAKGTPMREDALFRMASTTKQVLGVAAMMMIEEGRFSPNDAVGDYIPEFSDIKVAVLADPADEDISPEYVLEDPPPHRLVDPHRPVTILDLLTHTSGLGTYGLGMAISDWPWDAGETLATWIPKIAKGPLDYQPGARWQYSPMLGLDVVARLIEIVSGQPFQDLVQQRIFDPLKMHDTHWNLPEEKASRLVVMEKDEGDFAGKKIGFRMPPGYYSASVGLMSSVHDFLNFHQMLTYRGELFGHRLLKEASVAEMSSNHLESLYRSKADTEGLGFGYAVEVLVDPDKCGRKQSTGSYGWGGAFGTLSWNEPEKDLAVVVLVQKLSETLRDDVTTAIHAATEGIS
ncbi:MAG: serine hydrolase domain-containing protein [Woeseiaceae bacterium]